jgi:transposase
MIWGAFVNTTKLNLVFMELGKRTGPDFVEQVYEGSIQPFLTSDMCSDDMTLMEDGAPVHGCKVAKEWRENHGVSKIKWPANSPDMNPIENVWRRMKKSISKNHNIKTAAAMRIHSPQSQVTGRPGQPTTSGYYQIFLDNISNNYQLFIGQISHIW